MKLLDLYIIRKFLGTFFFVMVLLLCISVVFDLSEKIDRFIQSEAGASEVLFKYYLNFVIHYGNLFSALFIFISVIWFTSKMASNSEVVAILSSGVSFPRFLFPYFIGATILVLLSLYLNHFVVPHSNDVRLTFEERYMGGRRWENQKKVHRQIASGKLIYFKAFFPGGGRGYSFSMEQWNEDRTALEYKLIAEQVMYDSATGKWDLNSARIRRFTEEGDTVQKLVAKDTLLGFKPEDIGQDASLAETMTYGELNRKIEAEKKKGSDNVVHFQLEKHKRTSYPLGTYVLTLIGVSIASRNLKGGLGLHIAIGLGIAVSYIFFMKIFTVAATNAGMSPLLAVWIPNGLFLLIGLGIYYQAPK